MTPAEANAHAKRLAVALGETGAEGQSPLPLVLMQLSRIVRLMGVEWAEERLQSAIVGHGAAAVAMTPSRSLGGVFFALCRDAAFPAIETGVLTRRDFCRTFCVRPRVKKAAPVRKPKPPKPPKPPQPPQPPPKPKAPDGPRPWTPRHKRPAVDAEVYVSVRRKA